MSNVVIKEPERPKMEVIYEGLFGPKIDKITIWLVLLLLFYGLSICLALKG